MRTITELDEAFQERAAIMEFDGGLSRAEAEREAARLVYGLRGVEALNATLAAHIPLKPFFDKSADSKPESYRLDLPLREGERFKAYIGGRFLCLDVDRYHKDGVDGAASLSAWLKTRGIDENTLQTHCWTATPSGGLHLYFRYTGEPLRFTLCPGVEVKTQTITAPGSYKGGKPYSLHGNFADAPPAPLWVLQAAPEKAQPASSYGRRARKPYGAVTWQNIVDWTQTDARGAEGRNALAFSLAYKARWHAWTEGETLEALRSEGLLGGLPDSERRTACASAFKGAA